MSNKVDTKKKTEKAPKENPKEIKLADGEGQIITGYLKKIDAMFAVLSEPGRLAFFHLIIDGNKELNDKRNELLKTK